MTGTAAGVNWSARHERGVVAARRDGGFTLVELAVSMMVLTVGILAVANVFAGSLQATGLAAARTRAAALATRELEAMRTLPYADVVVAAAEPASIIEQNVAFTVERLVEWAVVDTESHAYKRIGVTVRWRDRAGGHAVRQTGALYPGSAASSPTTLASAALPAPANLIAVLDPAAPDSQVVLSWESFATPAAWEVQHSLDVGFPPERAVIDTASHPGEATTFLATGLSPATTFHFRVRALDGAGAPSSWSNVQAATTAPGDATECMVAGAKATPSQVPRTNANKLSTDVLVEVRTNGACGPLTLTFRPLANTALQRLAPDRSSTSGVVEWTIRKSALSWDLGPTTVAVEDAPGHVIADVSFVVCEPERCA